MNWSGTSLQKDMYLVQCREWETGSVHYDWLISVKFLKIYLEMEWVYLWQLL